MSADEEYSLGNVSQPHRQARAERIAVPLLLHSLGDKASGYGFAIVKKREKQ
jgi:hypothetical protein